MDSSALRRIQDAKLRRLEVLEEQAAQLGPAAPPHIITTRDELRAELRAELGIIDAVLRPPIDAETRRAFQRYDQLDLVVNVVAGGLQRLSRMEASYQDDVRRRSLRQNVYDAWMLLITLGLLYLIFR